jgi:hypothetical protein
MGTDTDNTGTGATLTVPCADQKSAKWEITEDIKDFPFLGEQELRNITCGVIN